MTSLWILSDLHRDHGKFDLDVPAGADVAVIAGDVVDDQFLAEMASRIPTVFVAGNHEFYGHEVGPRRAELAAIPNLYFLDDSSVTVEGVLFIGSTLWTDYGRNPVAADAARHGMNDHRFIRWNKEPWQRFLPSHATALHEASRAYLEAELRRESDSPVVVVTHHAPSERSVHPKYAGQILNRAYYSDMDAVVEASGAALWVHGHVHTNFDYAIGGTRVLCNPHGYPRDNPDFNPALIVEV